MMKKEPMTQNKVKILEKEIITLAEQLEAMSKKLEDLKDLKNELKGIKLFLGRVYPEFKTWFPEIMQKVYKRR
jgi:acyl carrier protein phosphodiesterase